MLPMAWRCSTLAVSSLYFNTLELLLTLGFIYQDIVHGDVKCENVLIFEDEHHAEEYRLRSKAL